MFETFLLVCFSVGGCMMAEDTEGPHTSQEACYQRAAEIYMDIADHFAGQGIQVVWTLPNCKPEQTI